MQMQSSTRSFIPIPPEPVNPTVCNLICFAVDIAWIIFCERVFEITAGGTLGTLHRFDSTDGAAPGAGLIQATNGSRTRSGRGRDALSRTSDSFRRSIRSIRAVL
jgi:hypothetical protein